ncbi:AaceriAAR067Wp [[Ashbya] aceris (nom. inval.)]|nr:AaceriAAR067Wp [[Ashbya] aceris (nom. inval.)]
MLAARFPFAAARPLCRTFQIPTTGSKVLPVYPPIEQRARDVIKQISEAKLAQLDPQGIRRKMLSKAEKDCVKAGDIVRVMYDTAKCNYGTIYGYVLSVDRGKIVEDSSLLLRNHIGKTSVETRVPVFSPLLARIDILRRGDPKRRRNKHYYIRNTRLDVGDLESSMRRRNR